MRKAAAGAVLKLIVSLGGGGGGRFICQKGGLLFVYEPLNQLLLYSRLTCARMTCAVILTGSA